MSEQDPNEQTAVRDAIVAATKAYGLKEYIGTKRIRAVGMVRSEYNAIAAGIASYDEANATELHNALVIQASYEGKSLEQVKQEFDERVRRRKAEFEKA